VVDVYVYVVVYVFVCGLCAWNWYSGKEEGEEGDGRERGEEESTLIHTHTQWARGYRDGGVRGKGKGEKEREEEEERERENTHTNTDVNKQK
jgi:hypothetical protein